MFSLSIQRSEKKILEPTLLNLTAPGTLEVDYTFYTPLSMESAPARGTWEDAAKGSIKYYLFD